MIIINALPYVIRPSNGFAIVLKQMQNLSFIVLHICNTKLYKKKCKLFLGAYVHYSFELM